MYPQTHFLFPFFISLILVRLDIISLGLALISGFIGVFIDIDHYIEHIIHSKSKRFSLKATWNNSNKFHRFNQRSLIHNFSGAIIITMILVLLTFWYWKVALILAIAYYSHLLLDHIHLKREKFLNWRIGKLYIRESYTGIFLDVILTLAIIILLILEYFS